LPPLMPLDLLVDTTTPSEAPLALVVVLVAGVLPSGSADSPKATATTAVLAVGLNAIAVLEEGFLRAVSVLFSGTADLAASLPAVGEGTAPSAPGPHSDAEPPAPPDAQESNFGLGIEDTLRRLDLHRRMDEREDEDGSSKSAPRDKPDDAALAVKTFWHAVGEGLPLELDL